MYSKDLQLEHLPQDNSIILLDSPAAFEAANGVLSSCAGYCFGLLLAARGAGAQQYFTSLVGLTKEQQASLKKAAAEQRKASKARPQPEGSTEAVAGKDTSMAGVAILPLQGEADGATMFVYLLPEHHPQQQQQGAGLVPAAQQLLTRCLTSTQCPCLCFDAKAVLVNLQQQQQQQQQQVVSGQPSQQQQQQLLHLQLPQPQQQQQRASGWALPPSEALQLVDPWVLGWVLEAQLVQDAKDSSECYGLLQQLARSGLVRRRRGRAGWLCAPCCLEMRHRANSEPSSESILPKHAGEAMRAGCCNQTWTGSYQHVETRESCLLACSVRGPLHWHGGAWTVMVVNDLLQAPEAHV
jgi:hypothetical protein